METTACVIARDVTLPLPGWRNWSDAPDLKSGGPRAVRVRVPLPASAGQALSWANACTASAVVDAPSVARAAASRRSAVLRDR
jgi:hypothetical protein